MSKIRQFTAGTMAVGLAACISDNAQQEESPIKPKIVEQKAPEAHEATEISDIAKYTSDHALNQTLDIAGGDSFDTEVSGMLLNKNGLLYLDISSVADPRFETSVRTMIDEGNTLNDKGENSLLFRLSCIENGKFVSDSGITGLSNLPKIDGVVRPFTLGFKLTEETGMADGKCVSLADSISSK